MREVLKRRPSPAMAVALAAMVVAIAGTAIATPLAVKSALSKKEKKQTKSIADSQITARASGLSVANATTVGGTPLSGLLTTAGCQPGKILGVAKIAGDASVSATFSTSAVSNAMNCTGGTVEVRRESVGLYDVRFNGLATSVAILSGAESGTGETAASAGKILAGPDAGAFQVKVRNLATDALADESFTIITL